MPHFETLDDLKISHIPDFEKYSKRLEILAPRYHGRAAVPAGFPLTTDTPSVWSSDSLEINKVTYDLSTAEIREIEEALSRFKDSGAPLNDLCPETFVLHTLGSRLRNISNEIHKGKGIAIVRGMPPDAYSLRDNVIIHAGISSYVASQRGSQSGFDDQVFHICSREGMSIKDLKSNSTTDYLPFHTDDTDILAFYVVETSVSGGEMLWASQGQVYNELATHRPEVLRILSESSWPLQTVAEPPTIVRVPLLYLDERGPYFWLGRAGFTGRPRSPRPTSIPGLTDEQADALDAVHFAAVKHAVKVPPRKGEMYFVNNLSILHSRAAFEDDLEQDPLHPGGRRRHLFRLWLRDPFLGRKVAEPLRKRWEDVFNAESAKHGRWLLTRDMEPNVVSERLFKAGFPGDTFNSCQNT